MDYYLVLGIPRTESAQGVRDAFRKLALRYHPDRAGPGSTRQFQDIVEAFQVLSDPQLREDYDRRWRPSGEQQIPVAVSPAPRSSRRPTPVEPLSFFRDSQQGRPAVEEVFERFFRDFSGRSVPKAEPLDLDLILTREEARRGGSVWLAVPTFRTCEYCGRVGEEGFFPCVACKGSGLIQGEQPVEVAVPAMVPAGAVLEIPLEGIDDLYLRVRILIGG